MRFGHARAHVDHTFIISSSHVILLLCFPFLLACSSYLPLPFRGSSFSLSAIHSGHSTHLRDLFLVSSSLSTLIAFLFCPQPLSSFAFSECRCPHVSFPSLFILHPSSSSFLLFTRFLLSLPHLLFFCLNLIFFLVVVSFLSF